MVGIPEQIIVFYVLGLILFIIGIEDKRIPNLFIYLGLSLFVNIMGYYISYKDADFVQTAYFSIVLAMLSIVFLIWKGFEFLKIKFDDRYQDREE
jgi:hypothetical protein